MKRAAKINVGSARAALRMLAFKLPDCLFSDCVDGYDIEIISSKIKEVRQTPADSDCDLLAKDDKKVKAFVDDFLAALKKKIKAKPGSPCKGDCKCASSMTWGKPISQTFFVPIKLADDCEYEAEVDVTYKLGKMAGTCVFPDNWRPEK